MSDSLESIHLCANTCVERVLQPCHSPTCNGNVQQSKTTKIMFQIPFKCLLSQIVILPISFSQSNIGARTYCCNRFDCRDLDITCAHAGNWDEFIYLIYGHNDKIIFIFSSKEEYLEEKAVFRSQMSL